MSIRSFLLRPFLVRPFLVRPFLVRSALAVLLAAGSAGGAQAHAFLRHAAPPVGSTLATAPADVALDFTEAIEPRFSGIDVLDAQGQHMADGDLHLAPDNPKRLVIGLKKLPPGAYTVKWHVTSVDTHHTEGAFTFSVQP